MIERGASSQITDLLLQRSRSDPEIALEKSKCQGFQVFSMLLIYAEQPRLC